MSSSISTELKTFRDSLSNAFALFAVGNDTFDNANKLTKVFDQLLDHEITNLERRLSEKDQLQTISAGYLEKPTQLPSDDEEKEVEVHPPTLVIHAEPSVIVEKYEAPKSVANMILSHPPPPSPISQEEEDEEIEEVADVEEEEQGDDEETEVLKINKKKYHVGVISKTVYQFIDEETMGETLGTLKDCKIIA